MYSWRAAVKILLASTIAALLASTPAFAQQTTIFADSETAGSAQGQDAGSITLEGFNGGVSSTDAHDGGGAMVIQMLMPNTGGAAAGTPGPFVPRAAVTNSH
jgi:hypothetical protein